MNVRALVIATILSGLLAACGVRGKPEEPAGAQSNKDEPVVLDPLIK